MAEETGNTEVQADWHVAFGAARTEAVSGRAKNPKTPKKSEHPTDEQKRLADIANELSDPIYWEGIVRMPADIMLAKTGHKHWDIPDKEVKSVAVPLAFSAKTFISLDPRMILLAITLANVGKMYLPRSVQEYNLRKQEALDKIEGRELQP